MKATGIELDFVLENQIVAIRNIFNEPTKLKPVLSGCASSQILLATSNTRTTYPERPSCVDS